jgi:hypothetical protein
VTADLPPSLRRAAAVLFALAAAFAFSVANAAETRWWIADSAGDHARSESRGVSVRPDGSIELGPAAESWPIDSLVTAWAVSPLAGGAVAIAGDHGRILRWTARDGAHPWVRLPVGQVFCLAADGDGLVAGTGPEGWVYRIGSNGDTARVAATGERYVWGLAAGGRGVWYAATGTRGRVMRIENGRSHVVFDSDESNLVSIVADGEGGVYVGGDSRGRIVRVDAGGGARTVFDAPEDEIRSLARGADGALYAAALSASATTAPDDQDPAGASTPAPEKSAVSGGRATVYRIVPDSVASSWWVSPHPFLYAVLWTPEGTLAASGNRAALYRIERASGATQWLAAPQGQVTALARSADGAILAATSNPAALWRLGPGRSSRGELTGPALDARRVAQLGRLLWHGDAGGGRVELHARSGNTDPPDSTWSAWVGGAAGEDGLRPRVPAARYHQWRLGLAGGNPRIASVEASWRERNLPPRVEELVVGVQGRDFREGELMPRSQPVTQTLPGGQKVEYSLNPPSSPREVRELPVWARGLRTAQWRGADPNGDPLRFRVEVRGEAGGDWIVLGRDLEAPTWTFDTQTLADGRYRLRVVASDQAANPVGEESEGEAVSAPFTVDNHPPAVLSLAATPRAGAVEVEARAEDALSPLARIEIALDDGDWRAVTPVGGFTDERDHTIRTTLRDVAPGEHSVGVRAVDGAGNAATRATRVRVTVR